MNHLGEHCPALALPERLFKLSFAEDHQAFKNKELAPGSLLQRVVL